KGIHCVKQSLKIMYKTLYRELCKILVNLEELSFKIVNFICHLVEKSSERYFINGEKNFLL
ncbi:hypothetical protein, partial [Candidatus Ichthyocystis hellenicum]|uniref:hypothetical protein n=1 Tax=Candidatus Ichthyocystis hellenicum TaxID=1561003 RepID=UPI001F5FAD1D